MPELKLSDQEKRDLEALFLRAELLSRDMERVYAELQTTNKEIAELIYEKAKAQGLEIASYQPQFRNYRLEKIEVTLQDSGETSSP
jgi:hypothetical protein